MPEFVESNFTFSHIQFSFWYWPIYSAALSAADNTEMKCQACLLMTGLSHMNSGAWGMQLTEAYLSHYSCVLKGTFAVEKNFVTRADLIYMHCCRHPHLSLYYKLCYYDELWRKTEFFLFCFWACLVMNSKCSIVWERPITVYEKQLEEQTFLCIIAVFKIFIIEPMLCGADH